MCFYLKPPSAAAAVERDVLMYRAYVAQRKYTVVIDEVKATAAAELQAVRLLAQYLHSPGKRCVCVCVCVFDESPG